MTCNVGVGKSPSILQGALGNHVFLCRKFRREVSLILLSQCLPKPCFCFNTQIYYYSFASLWVDRNNWEIVLSMLDQIQGAPDRSLFWDPWCSHFLLKGAGIFWPLKPALLSRWQSNSFLDFHQALAFGSIYCIKRGKHLRLVEVKSRSFPACHSHPGEAPKELLFYK